MKNKKKNLKKINAMLKEMDEKEEKDFLNSGGNVAVHS